MFIRPAIKPLAGKLHRSGFHHFTTVMIPAKRAAETDAWLDALGGVLMVGLVVTLVFMMRLVLAN